MALSPSLSRDEQSLLSLLHNARKLARSIGATSASYRLVPTYHSQLDKDATLFHFGFPDAWIALYDRDHEFRKHDPIADYVIRTGKPMAWKQAIEDQDLTSEQSTFVQSMKEHGLIHGWAAPFFGPQGREAYVTYSFGRELTADDAKSLRTLTAHTEIFHKEMVLLAASSKAEIRSLSSRESEVLLWIARGKSNSDIATILEVSGGTIDTFVRRIFEKLNVNHRIAATLKGLHLGLLRL